MTLNILKGYEETISKCIFNNNVTINFITNNKDEEFIDFNKKTINNLKNNIAFWSQYWLPDKDVIVLHGDENDLEWMRNQLTELNMVDGLNMRQITSRSNGGGGGIAGVDRNIPVFWQIIGSDVSASDLNNVGMAKLSGHLYAHIAQPGFLNSLSDQYIKYTDLPAWYVEGQSDYHTLCLLNDNFIANRKNFLTTAYVPEGYRQKIKNNSKDDWFSILSNDTNFEGIPVTYEYWSGFIVYEYLIDKFGIDLVMSVQKDFVKTLNFRESMNNVFGLNYKDFYTEMSTILYDAAKDIVI